MMDTIADAGNFYTALDAGKFTTYTAVHVPWGERKLQLNTCLLLSLTRPRTSLRGSSFRECPGQSAPSPSLPGASIRSLPPSFTLPPCRLLHAMHDRRARRWDDSTLRR